MASCIGRRAAAERGGEYRSREMPERAEATSGHTAWSASRAPGPLRAFYQRVMARRGFQTAVATARRMTVLAWRLATKDQDYANPLLIRPDTSPSLANLPAAAFSCRL
jgi:hypothetical protein